ncbi:MAG: cobalt transporter CbiM [Ilumatobacteraceae bacterium]
MHIPDGYLSPQSCGVMTATMVPAWAIAGRRVRRVVKNRHVPLLAIGAAYCFLVMMFNIPIPDGTTAHAVGGVLVAVVLGPEAALIAVSVALAIQALFFGDGGILAFGANCFNMAVVLPMTGYLVYRLLSRNTALTAPRRAFAAGIGAYVGINLAALCAAIEFGLQPTLFHSANGTPLYAPFHLAQTIPAMALAHLTIAGGVELVLTTGVIAYLQRANLPLLRINHPDVPGTPEELVAPKPFGWKWAVVFLGTLVVLTPLGLIAPGGAFGEDAPEDLDLGKYGLNAVPSGLRHYAGFWHHALFEGYGFSSDEHPTIGYLVSAVFGIAVIAAAILLTYLAIRTVRNLRRRSVTATTPTAAGG